MTYTDLDRLIAFAGIYQAAYCVRQIARQGTVDTRIMEPCIYSLFQIDTPTVAAAFGPSGAVASGARQIVAQLTAGSKSGPPRDQELLRYVVTLIKLERALSGRRDMLETIRAGIDAIAAARDDGPLLDPSLLASLAAIYSDTVSHLSPRIIVKGEPLHLKNPDNQNRIRSNLLAGIRAAMLWRQVGGRRWQILFGQRQLLESARGYLASAVLG
jgi:high frequency lysogenization protein